MQIIVNDDIFFFYFKANAENWNKAVPDTLNDDFGYGGFTPYGVLGIFQGAAMSTIIFIGFDILLLSNKMVKKSLSYGGAISYGIVFIAIFCCATILTLMIPYYLQVIYFPYKVFFFPFWIFFFRFVNIL